MDVRRPFPRVSPVSQQYHLQYIAHFVSLRIRPRGSSVRIKRASGMTDSCDQTILALKHDFISPRIC
jgi:hypothetical protein